MRLQSTEDFATAIRAVEAELGVLYPPSAAGLFAELAAIFGTGHSYGLHLLTTATAVAAIRDELGGPLYDDGYLLPFLSDGDRDRPDVYGFDLSDPARQRIAVYAVHTIVEVWPNHKAFLAWAHTQAPPPTTPEGAA